MVIKRYIKNVSILNKDGGVSMENVISMDKYIEDTQSNECEWDIIRNICQKAIQRKGYTSQQVHEISKKILREVREDK
jgi:hypothetical protein